MSLHGNMSSLSSTDQVQRKCQEFTLKFNAWVESVQNIGRQQTAEFDKQLQSDTGTFLSC